MTHQFTHYFDELKIVNDLAVYAWGEAEITYKIRRKDSDVGIFDDYLDDIDVKSITVYSDQNGQPAKALDKDHWLYLLIEDALHASGELVNACQNNME